MPVQVGSLKRAEDERRLAAMLTLKEYREEPDGSWFREV